MPAGIINVSMGKQNCWYFCFVIQRLLSREGDGWFEKGEQGEVKYGDLAPDATSQIEERVAGIRDMPLTVSGALSCLLLLNVRNSQLSEQLDCIRDDQTHTPNVLEKASSALVGPFLTAVKACARLILPSTVPIVGVGCNARFYGTG
jgi:hypothetical protein